MKTKKLLLLALPFLALGSCSKDHSKQSVSVLDGTYSGKFTETSLNDATSSDSVQFIMGSGRFNTIMSDKTVTTGDGTFKVTAQTVNFTDMDAFPANPAINSDAALTGTYNYVIKKDSLYLTKTDVNKTTFSYKLKKH